MRSYTAGWKTGKRKSSRSGWTYQYATDPYGKAIKVHVKKVNGKIVKIGKRYSV